MQYPPSRWIQLEGGQAGPPARAAAGFQLKCSLPRPGRGPGLRPGCMNQHMMHGYIRLLSGSRFNAGRSRPSGESAQAHRVAGVPRYRR